MGISVKATNQAAKHKNALVLCCDEKYLPYAALAVHTALRNNPDRDFDICITSLDEVVMPPALDGRDVRICQIEVGDAFDALPTSERFPVAAYLRLALPEALASDYDRILYIDCDVFVVGEALGEVFKLDLAGMPVGAATDCFKFKYPRRATKDQVALETNGSYFNSGVMLVDISEFIEQQIRDKCARVASRHRPDKLRYFDQTLLNFALRDNWAVLHPAWNWQWAIVRPLFELFIDTQIVHFVSHVKPWSDPRGTLPIKYRETARRFFEKYYPELTENIGTPARELKKRKMLARLLKHVTRSFTFVRRYNGHGGDIMKVLPRDY